MPEPDVVLRGGSVVQPDRLQTTNATASASVSRTGLVSGRSAFERPGCLT
jgi:hypothetical protein